MSTTAAYFDDQKLVALRDELRLTKEECDKLEANLESAQARNTKSWFAKKPEVIQKEIEGNKAHCEKLESAISEVQAILKKIPDETPDEENETKKDESALETVELQPGQELNNNQRPLLHRRCLAAEKALQEELDEMREELETHKAAEDELKAKLQQSEQLVKVLREEASREPDSGQQKELKMLSEELSEVKEELEGKTRRLRQLESENEQLEVEAREVKAFKKSEAELRAKLYKSEQLAKVLREELREGASGEPVAWQQALVEWKAMLQALKLSSPEEDRCLGLMEQSIACIVLLSESRDMNDSQHREEAFGLFCEMFQQEYTKASVLDADQKLPKELLEELKEMKEKLETQEATEAELRATLQQVSSEKIEQREMVEMSQRLIDDLEASLEKSEKEKQEQMEKYAEAQTKNQENETQLKLSNDQLAAMEAKANDPVIRQARVETLEKEIEDKTSKNEQYDSQLKVLKDQLAAAEEKARQDVAKEHEVVIKDAENLLVELNEKVEMLEKENEAYNSQIELLKKQLADSEKNAEKCLSDLSQYENDQDKVMKKAESLIEDLNEKIEMLEKENKEYKPQLKLLEDQLADALKVAELKAQKQKIIDRLGGDQGDVIENAASIIEELNEVVVKYEMELKDTQEERKEERKEVQEAKERIREYESKVDLLKGRLVDAEDQLAAKEKNVGKQSAASQALVKEMEEQVSNLQAQLAREQTQHSKTQKALEKSHLHIGKESHIYAPGTEGFEVQVEAAKRREKSLMQEKKQLKRELEEALASWESEKRDLQNRYEEEKTSLLLSLSRQKK